MRTREKQQERWVEGDEYERNSRRVRKNGSDYGSDKEKRSGREKRRKDV